MAANSAQVGRRVSCTFLSQCIAEGSMSDKTVTPAAIIMENKPLVHLRWIVKVHNEEREVEKTFKQEFMSASSTTSNYRILKKVLNVDN